MAKHIKTGQGNLHLVTGDIAAMKVDVVVNAANDQLILGSGVAGAIKRAGGPAIQEACNRIGGTYVGGAVMTTGGNLPAQKVIHAVGPRMGEGDEEQKLRNATQNSLKLAEENRFNSIAFPAISTGVFGYPIEDCAKVMLEETLDFLQDAVHLKDVYFCLFDTNAYAVFEQTLEDMQS